MREKESHPLIWYNVFSHYIDHASCGNDNSRYGVDIFRDEIIDSYFNSGFIVVEVVNELVDEDVEDHDTRNCNFYKHFY